ncbi:hypothetical protein MKW98_012167, partial [Papaver atlanticum]
HALDNIVPENLGDTRTLQAVYELESLVLTVIVLKKTMKHLEGNSKSWNTDLLKWASGLIGGNEHEKGKGGSVVTFVDADQILRADMGELYDMVMKGKPYGCTPFCGNNKDDFRFWRQGFWEEHLRGRQYHISIMFLMCVILSFCSALYVMDLLNPTNCSRGQSEEARAKTIDLCNNPMRKDPKLQGAKRIVTEWPDLDLKACRFTAKITGEEIDDARETVTASTQAKSEASSIVEEDRESKRGVVIQLHVITRTPAVFI